MGAFAPYKWKAVNRNFFLVKHGKSSMQVQKIVPWCVYTAPVSFSSPSNRITAPYSAFPQTAHKCWFKCKVISGKTEINFLEFNERGAGETFALLGLELWVRTLFPRVSDEVPFKKSPLKVNMAWGGSIENKLRWRESCVLWRGPCPTLLVVWRSLLIIRINSLIRWFL